MAALHDLGLSPVRAEPRVWVKRLVVVERAGAEEGYIRDIALERGVNVVWAREPARRDSRTQISGHSAGKTTFCRLLRYILGEPTFATAQSTSMIEDAFPDGQVAAEIVIDSRDWAVRRPLGPNRQSRVLESGSVEDVLSGGGRPIIKDDYVSELGLGRLLEGMPAKAVTSRNEPISWGHILAWCSRDQEARFRSLHDWRDPRSDSQSPEFTFRRAGPLFVIRSALGLLQPAELGHEERIAALRAKQEALQRAIDDEKRIPAVMTARARKRLKALLTTRLGSDAADALDNDDGTLFASPAAVTDQAVMIVGRSVAEVQTQIDSVQEELDNNGATLRERQETLEFVSDMILAYGTAAEEAGSSEVQDARRRLEADRSKLCAYGNVLIGDCSHVKARQDLIRAEELSDARANERLEAQFSTEVDRFREQHGRISADLVSLQAVRTTLIDRRSTLQRAMRQAEREVDALRAALEDLEAWTHHGAEDSQVRINKMQEEYRELQKEESTAESQFHIASWGAETNVGVLNSIYAALVQDVVAANYSGQAVIERRELAFNIVRGAAMSGEAVETLGILMADIASMAFSAVTDGNSHPGFLIHDSPREADLAESLYGNLILACLRLEQELGGHGTCPFQYILTTTSAPPEEAQDSRHLKLELDASQEQEMLLRRDVSVARATLLNPPNDA